MTQFYWLSPQKATAGGMALNLDDFDEAIDAVDAPCLIVIPKELFALWLEADTAPQGAGNLVEEIDALANPLYFYNDLPILLTDGRGTDAGRACIHLFSNLVEAVDGVLGEIEDAATSDIVAELVLKLIPLASVSITGIAMAAPTSSQD